MVNPVYLFCYDCLLSILTGDDGSWAKDDFVRKLLAETENDKEELIRKRIDFASQNSWEARTESFGDILVMTERAPSKTKYRSDV